MKKLILMFIVFISITVNAQKNYYHVVIEDKVENNIYVLNMTSKDTLAVLYYVFIGQIIDLDSMFTNSNMSFESNTSKCTFYIEIKTKKKDKRINKHTKYMLNMKNIYKISEYYCMDTIKYIIYSTKEKL